MNLSKRELTRRLAGTFGFNGNLKSRSGEMESEHVWSFHKCLDEIASHHIQSLCPSGQDFKSRKKVSNEPDLGHELIPGLGEGKVPDQIHLNGSHDTENNILLGRRLNSGQPKHNTCLLQGRGWRDL